MRKPDPEFMRAWAAGQQRSLLLSGWRVTQVDGIELYHQGDLGEGVAANVARLVRALADRASLQEIPPVTLEPPHAGSDRAWWGRPWPAVAAWRGFFGNAGASYDERARGEGYDALILAPIENPHPLELEDPSTRKTLRA